MIAFVQGEFVQKTPACVHVLCGGVGYEVQISLQTYSDIANEKQGKLLTYLQVREDAHVLYGFSKAVEKELFLNLIGVNGVGAATARVMLSGMRADELNRVIVQGNTKQLESIKGIGKKTAERIVLELREKLVKTAGAVDLGGTAGNSLEADALNALLALGIPRQAAENGVKKVLGAEPGIGLETLIKKALQNL
jgi:holliday junction DNA helicase RuvA